MEDIEAHEECQEFFSSVSNLEPLNQAQMLENFQSGLKEKRKERCGGNEECKKDVEEAFSRWNKCSNPRTYFTSQNVAWILPEELYIIEEDGINYCFTQRELWALLKLSVPYNPATQRPLSSEIVDTLRKSISPPQNSPEEIVRNSRFKGPRKEVDIKKLLKAIQQGDLEQIQRIGIVLAPEDVKAHPEILADVVAYRWDEMLVLVSELFDLSKEDALRSHVLQTASRANNREFFEFLVQYFGLSPEAETDRNEFQKAYFESIYTGNRRITEYLKSLGISLYKEDRIRLLKMTLDYIKPIFLAYLLGPGENEINIPLDDLIEVVHGSELYSKNLDYMRHKDPSLEAIIRFKIRERKRAKRRERRERIIEP